MLISDRQTVPFLPANPEYSATRNQVTELFAAILYCIANTYFKLFSVTPFMAAELLVTFYLVFLVSKLCGVIQCVT